MHHLTMLKRWCLFVLPHFKMGLFLWTPPGRFREEEFRLLQPGEQVTLTRLQKLAEVEYLAWFGMILFPSIKAVYRR